MTRPSMLLRELCERKGVTYEEITLVDVDYTDMMGMMTIEYIDDITLTSEEQDDE